MSIWRAKLHREATGIGLPAGSKKTACGFSGALAKGSTTVYLVNGREGSGGRRDYFTLAPTPSQVTCGTCIRITRDWSR